MPQNKTTDIGKKTIGTAVLGFLAGMVYRMGGSGNYPRVVRPLGVAACTIGDLFLLGLFNWGCLLIPGTVFIETTYWKKKGTDAQWYNWLLVGLAFSVVTLPWFVWDNVVRTQHGMPLRWVGYAIRTLLCTGFTVFWQEYLSDKVAQKLHVGKDITDEFGRGAIQLITLPLVLIG